MPAGGTLAITTSVVLVDDREAREHDASPGPYVVVSVTDTGHGMDAETRERAFEPFFTTKPLGKGSGLGLASVYGTVSQSGGFVRLESEVGAGTTVRIYLPFTRAEEEADSRPSPVELEPQSPVALLVEDEPLVGELVHGVLSGVGFDVQTARNGVDALTGLQTCRDPIALLVTDLVMPKMGGQELAERVRAGQPNVPVVFMSGYTETPPRLDLPGSGPTVFLKKPFSTAAFTEAIETMHASTAADSSVPALTNRERQVLRHLSHGMTNEKVATELGISAETVQSHVRNAMGKLDADTRTEAVATAIRLSLLE
jgi:DNA-binding NarL/FixJ family response regulator